MNSWKEFCGKQDREGVWEGIYRVIGRTKKRKEDLLMVKDRRVLSAGESVEHIADTFYPADDHASDNDHHHEVRRRAEIVNVGQQTDLPDPPFTMAELWRVVRSINPKKAPGDDGFTADICSQPGTLLGTV